MRRDLTRYFLRKVANQTEFSEHQVRRLFRVMIDVGMEVMSDGDEWRFPGLGAMFAVLGDDDTLSLRVIENQSFKPYMEKNFVENRENRV